MGTACCLGLPGRPGGPRTGARSRGGARKARGLRGGALDYGPILLLHHFPERRRGQPASAKGSGLLGASPQFSSFSFFLFFNQNLR